MNFRTRAGYGVGQAADGIKTAVFTFFVFFFYNQLLGLSGVLTGLALALALLVDAITDPMVGAWSDRWKSRWGRRHPFMLAGVLPFFLAMYALCNPPGELSEMQLFGWLLGADIAVRLAMTLFFVPFLSLGAELVREYHARTKLVALRTAFSYLGQFFVTILGFVVFFKASPEFTNGMQNPANYPPFGIFAGLLGAIAMLIAIASTWKMIPKLAAPVHQPNALHPLLGFITVFGTMKQQSFRVLCFTILAFMAIAGVSQTLLLYVGTFIFEFNEKQMGVLILAMLPGALLAPVVASRLSKSWGKTGALSICVVLGAFLSALPFLLYFAEMWQPMPVGTRVLLVLCSSSAANAFFFAYVTLLDSMLSDTIDERELETGHREEGLFFAARTFATKAAYGLGAFMAGVAIDVIAFPTKAKLGDVPAESIDSLAFLAGPVLIGLFLLTIAISGRYKLSAERHQKILNDIAAKDPSHAPIKDLIELKA